MRMHFFDIFAFLTFDFGPTNQAQEAQGTRGGPIPRGTRGAPHPAQATDILWNLVRTLIGLAKADPN